MINYRLYKNMNIRSMAYGKWYARAIHQLMEFDEFVEHMAQHHCVYSEGTIRGVLIEMETCLRELLLEGKAVRFDELGIFKIGIESNGVAHPYDYNAGQDVKNVRMNLYLGKRFLAKNLLADAKFKEAGFYDVDSAKPKEDEGENAIGG